MAREVYRELIQKKLKEGSDITKLANRLVELEEKKWGKKPGITSSRRANSSSVI